MRSGFESPRFRRFKMKLIWKGLQYWRDVRVFVTGWKCGPVDYKQDYLSNNKIDMGQKFTPFDLEAAKAGAP